jgi:DNA-directed RNA polymerase subunit RPC12/RpoP
MTISKKGIEMEIFECIRCGQEVVPSEHPEIGCDY